MVNKIKFQILIISLLLSSCATNILLKDSEPTLSLNQVNFISCVFNNSNDMTHDCKEELLLCLNDENKSVNNKVNKNIRLEIKRNKAESSSAVLLLSFLTLGVIPTHSSMFTETINFYDSETNQLLVSKEYDYRLEAGWFNYYKNRSNTQKNDLCSKVKSVVQN